MSKAWNDARDGFLDSLEWISPFGRRADRVLALLVLLFAYAVSLPGLPRALL